MTLPPALTASGDASAARPLHLLDRDALPDWLGKQPQQVRDWVAAHAFDASPGAWLTLPGDDGGPAAILGVGDRLDPFSYAHAPFSLPAGDWRLAEAVNGDEQAALALGWGLGSYRFDRYC